MSFVPMLFTMKCNAFLPNFCRMPYMFQMLIKSITKIFPGCGYCYCFHLEAANKASILPDAGKSSTSSTFHSGVILHVRATGNCTGELEPTYLGSCKLVHSQTHVLTDDPPKKLCHTCPWLCAVADGGFLHI